MYFGVLRKCECNMIQKKDAIIKEDHIGIMLDKPAKRRDEGFMRKVPRWMKKRLKFAYPNSINAEMIIADSSAT